MKEKDLHKIIRDNSTDDNTALIDALNARHPKLASGQNTREQSKNRKRSVNRLVAIFAPISAAAVLAAVLIPTLLLSSNNTPNNASNSSNSSQGSGETPNDSPQSPEEMKYNETIMHYTIQQYNEAYDTSFLYFDTVFTDYRLIEYSHIATQAFLGLEVRFTDADTNEKIEYVVCAPDAKFDFLSYNILVCTNQTTVSDCVVKWGATHGGSWSYGIFNYDNYDYYISVSNANESILFEYIKVMLSSRQ